MLTLIIKRNVKIILVIAICLLCIGSTYSKAVVSPTSQFYVNDYANLLSDDTKQYIINMNRELESKTGAQIVVVTVPSLEGQSLEDYANILFREFGIGDKQKKNGLLLLLALNERKFRVEVGYGLEGVLPDAKTGRMQDEYIIPYLKDDNWNDGIRNGFNAFLEEVAKEYNVEINGEKPINAESENIRYSIIPFIGFVVGRFIKTIFEKKNNRISAALQVVLISVVYGITAGVINTIITSHIAEFVVGFIFGIRRNFSWIFYSLFWSYI